MSRLTQTQTPLDEATLPQPPAAGDSEIIPPGAAAAVSYTDTHSPPTHYAPAPKQVCLKSLETGEKLAIVELHDFVFGVRPRIDVIHRVVVWQRARKELAQLK